MDYKLVSRKDFRKSRREKQRRRISSLYDKIEIYIKR